MDLLKYIVISLEKKIDSTKVENILRYFNKLEYSIDWDSGVPENWINIRNKNEFICWIGAVFPIIFIIESKIGVLKKYNDINDFVIIKIKNYDEDIWEISDIDEFMKICKEKNLYVDKKNFENKFSTHDFWWSTITA